MQVSSLQTGSHLIELLARRNDYDRNETTEVCSFSEISKPLVEIVNFFPIIPLKNFTDHNWHISFMILINKKLLLFYLAMILQKTILISYLFEYLKTYGILTLVLQIIFV